MHTKYLEESYSEGFPTYERIENLDYFTRHDHFQYLKPYEPEPIGLLHYIPKLRGIYERIPVKSTTENTLVHIYVMSELGDDAKALKITFDFIEGKFAGGDLKSVNSFLVEFNPEKVKRIVSVGVLRSTFRARTVLTEWENCFARVARTLNENNQSPDKYLRGLYPKNGRRLLAKRSTV